MKYSAAFLKKCAQVSTATIGHLTNFGFMDPGIRPLFPGARMSGPARTVQIPALDGTGIRAVLEQVRPGEVIVVDQGRNASYACWGEIITLRAQALGAAGAVVDGPATDPVEIEQAGFPVFSRSVSAITTKRYGIEGRVDVDVCAGNVVVHPGDLVIGDANGVVVLRPGEARALVEEALRKEEDEVRTRASIARGVIPDLKTVSAAGGSARRKGGGRKKR